MSQSYDIQTFYTAGSLTWTAPSWADAYTTVTVSAIGQGGGGAGADTGTLQRGAGGGGGGEFRTATWNFSDVGATATVIVGIGTGAGGAPASDGQAGNFSIFQSNTKPSVLLSCSGGLGGTTGHNGGLGGLGGSGGVGGVGSPGGNGGNGGDPLGSPDLNGLPGASSGGNGAGGGGGGAAGGDGDEDSGRGGNGGAGLAGTPGLGGVQTVDGHGVGGGPGGGTTVVAARSGSGGGGGSGDVVGPSTGGLGGTAGAFGAGGGAGGVGCFSAGGAGAPGYPGIIVVETNRNVPDPPATPPATPGAPAPPYTPPTTIQTTTTNALATAIKQAPLCPNPFQKLQAQNPVMSEVINRIQDNIWEAFEQSRKCRAWASAVASAVTTTATTISQAASSGGGVTPYVPPPPTPGSNLLWQNELVTPILPSTDLMPPGSGGTGLGYPLTSNREDNSIAGSTGNGDYYFHPGVDGDTVNLAVWLDSVSANSGVWQWTFQVYLGGSPTGGAVAITSATAPGFSYLSSLSIPVTNGTRLKVIVTGSQVSGTTTAGSIQATAVLSIMGPSTSGSGGGMITLSGDVTGAGITSIPTTLATVTTAGSFTNPNTTIDAKGRVLSASKGSGGSGVSNIDFLPESDPPTPGTTDTITYSSGLVTNETWVNTSNSHNVKTIDYTYSSGLAATEVRKVYDSAGTTVTGQITITYAYSGSTLTGSTIVRNI